MEIRITSIERGYTELTSLNGRKEVLSNSVYDIRFIIITNDQEIIESEVDLNVKKEENQNLGIQDFEAMIAKKLEGGNNEQ